MECLICKSNFENDKSFTTHLRSHKIKVKDYYLQNLPRYDLYSGELINFKSKEYYLDTDFNNRENMAKWYANKDEHTIKKYYIQSLQKILVKNKEDNYVFPPSQLECKSILLPSILYYEKFFKEDYSKFCVSLGFGEKYVYDKSIINKVKDIAKNKLKIAIDTREQLPLYFSCETVSQKLLVGDYTCLEPFNNIFIERKSIEDLVGTLGKGLLRFKAELTRAKELGAHLIIMVEGNYADLHKHEVFNRTKLTPKYIFHIIRELQKEFIEIQFLFTYNRVSMSNTIIKIFNMGNNVKSLDLQYLYDRKLI